jgi:hypothetical protein
LRRYKPFAASQAHGAALRRRDPSSHLPSRPYLGVLQEHQEFSFGLIMPIGLLHTAASGARRGMHSAGRIGSQLTCPGTGVPADLQLPQVWRYAISNVLKDQSLPAVAHYDPSPVLTFNADISLS